MEDGHLLVLDLPEVRELAARFGDPGELLRERFPITPDWMSDIAESGPVELGGEWVTLAPPSTAEPPIERSDGRSDRQLELLRELVAAIERREEGTYVLGLYRFNVELATPAGETCHVAIDHGRTEVVAGPAPGERLLTVRAECDLETLEDLVGGRVGPVDAQVAGRLWVSGSLGTRVLTSCTFRLLRIGGGR